MVGWVTLPHVKIPHCYRTLFSSERERTLASPTRIANGVTPELFRPLSLEGVAETGVTKCLMQ